MLLIKSTQRAPQLFSCPALLIEVCGDVPVPGSSYCGVSSCSTDYMDFLFFGVLLYNKATVQLQECEKCKKPGGRLAGSGVCCECVGGRAVLHRQLLPNKTGWFFPRKVF